MVKKDRHMVKKERNNVSLNIKDPEAHRLAQAIAQATGQTMTRAVTEALRERYERLERRETKALHRECGLSPIAPPPTSSVPTSITPNSSTMNTACRK